MAIPLLPDDPHDTRLRTNVKPPGWANPAPAARYHLVVLGGGPAGLVAAAGASALGAKVALVERDLLGGDCLNVGCVPSKTLLRAARAAAEVRRARDFGIRTAEPEVDFAAVMERVRRVRADLSPVDSAERFRKLGVDVFLGEGSFLDERTVEVEGAKLNFGRCLIATGAKAVIPGTVDLKGKKVYTNESIFAITERPDRLLVVGGGATGCELGQAFARLGTRVGIVSRSGRILNGEDEEAARVVAASLDRDGIVVGKGPFEADTVLVAVGSRANTAGLNLEAAGVTYSTQEGIRVDDHLRTSNPRIYAAGDVCSLGYKFTHAADAMARIAIRNALFPGGARVSALTIPSCIYTQPELGQVGLTERRAMENGVAVDIYRLDLDEVDRAAIDGQPGFIKVLAAKGSDRILGATVVGSHAGEIVGTVSLAVAKGIGLKSLATAVFPYPTVTGALRSLGDQYNRTRLTPMKKRLVRGWLRWFR